MKRRTFLGLAGLAAGLGFPFIAISGQRRIVEEEESSSFATAPALQSPEARLTHQAIIKVVGVGGAGIRIVQHMSTMGMPGVEYICADTDAQALCHSTAANRILLEHDFGTRNLEKMNHAHHERIAAVIEGADMVFITAGMGGRTGTAATSIVADAARELGILTVGVVNTPFSFEGSRIGIAENGLAELAQRVDAFIAIDLNALVAMLPDNKSMAEAFSFSDLHIQRAIGGIAGIINAQGFMTLDFDDVLKTLICMGDARMGFASARGVNRATMAAEGAMSYPLMRRNAEKRPMENVLFNIAASRHIIPREVVQVFDAIQQHAGVETNVLGGAIYDDSMRDQLRVTVIAS